MVSELFFIHETTVIQFERSKTTLHFPAWQSPGRGMEYLIVLQHFTFQYYIELQTDQVNSNVFYWSAIRLFLSWTPFPLGKIKMCIATWLRWLWNFRWKCGIYEGVSKSFRNHPKEKEPDISFLYWIHKTCLKSYYANLHILPTCYWLSTYQNWYMGAWH